jgi:hypothetical protein
LKLLTAREKGILDEAIAGANVDDEANRVVVHSIGRLYFLYNHLAKAITNIDMTENMYCPFCRVKLLSVQIGTKGHGEKCLYWRLKEGRE